MSRYLPDKNHRPESVKSTLERRNSRWNTTAVKINSFKRVHETKLLLSVTRNSANSLVENGQNNAAHIAKRFRELFRRKVQSEKWIFHFHFRKKADGSGQYTIDANLQDLQATKNRVSAVWK